MRRFSHPCKWPQVMICRSVLVYNKVINVLFCIQDLVVNHLHPGDVQTEMSSGRGNLKPDEGCKSTIYAALLPPNTPIKGEFIWEDCSVKDWVKG